MNTLQVKHGSLELNVPLSVFVKGTCDLSKDSDVYFGMLQQRYPWLNDNSIAVLKRRVQEEMRTVIEQQLRGPKKARMLSAEGKDMQAIQHLESYLIDFPDDGDAWYVLGEILCKIGRNEDGYKAINHGRRLLF
jgi:tetratricopeptide (TPR) repeat protein